MSNANSFMSQNVLLLLFYHEKYGGNNKRENMFVINKTPTSKLKHYTQQKQLQNVGHLWCESPVVNLLLNALEITVIQSINTTEKGSLSELTVTLC